MTTKHFGLAALIGASLLSVCSANAESSGARAVRALYSRWNHAFSTHNLKQLASCYGADLYAFDVVPPRAYPTKAAYMNDFAEFFKLFPGPANCKFEDLSITAVGSFAYTHGVADMTMTDPKGNKTEDVVRFTDVLRKRNGRWQVVQEHVSVPVDMMTGKPDMMSKP